MDFETIAHRLEAVPQLQEQISRLNLEVLELRLRLNGQQLQITEPTPEPSPGPTFLDLVEDSITTRITGWKYAQQVNGNWRAPYTASAAAEAAGDKNRWREVKSAIQRGGFERLRWFKAPPPQDWRGGDRHAEMIQWVEVISD
jgi:hypothetical protein